MASSVEEEPPEVRQTNEEDVHQGMSSLSGPSVVATDSAYNNHFDVQPVTYHRDHHCESNNVGLWERQIWGGNPDIELRLRELRICLGEINDGL